MYLTLPICMEKSFLWWELTFRLEKNQWNNFRGLMSQIMIRKCYHLLFHTVPMFLLWWNIKQWQMKLDRGPFYQNVLKFCQMVHTHLVSSSLLNICTVPVGRKPSLGFPHRWKVLIISLLITTWSWQLTLSPLFFFICVYLQCQCKDVWGSFSWCTRLLTRQGHFFTFCCQDMWNCRGTTIK